MLISEANEMTLRPSMEVYCGLSSEEDSSYASLSFNNVKTASTSANVLNGKTIKPLCDFQGDGFPMDGSCWVFENLRGNESYMYGVQTNIGGTSQVVINRTSSSIKYKAFTFWTYSGEGTITYDGITYAATKNVTIPINTNTYPITITIKSTNPEKRLILSRVNPGIFLEFHNEDLISLNATLRSDLTLDNPSLPVSEFTFSAISPGNPDMLSNIPEGTPIWFYAGYPGDYCDLRNFYLSEQITIENGVITVSAEDSVAKFDEYEHISTAHSNQQVSGDSPCWLVYDFDRAIHKCCPQARRLPSPVDPELFPDWDEFLEVYYQLEEITGETSWVTEECSMRDFIATGMNLIDINLPASYGTFRCTPRFIDAGIPVVKYIYDDTPLWTIEESMVADHKPGYEKKISRVKLENSSTYGARGSVTGLMRGYDFIAANTGDIITINPPHDNYVFVPSLITYTGASVISESAYEIVLKATRTSVEVPDTVQSSWRDVDGVWQESSYKNMVQIHVNCMKIQADSYTEIADTSILTNNLLNWTTNALGYCSVGSERKFTPFPSARKILDRSPHVGTFTWRGNPKMQPRDIFTFRKLNGIDVVCTIESITLDFEGGGLSSEITYREGAVV